MSGQVPYCRVPSGPYGGSTWDPMRGARWALSGGPGCARWTLCNIPDGPYVRVPDGPYVQVPGGPYVGSQMDPGPRWTLCTGPMYGSQVLPHTLVPGTSTASYPGPRSCLIFWSQVLSHTLVLGTASYPGPRYCLIPWSQVLPMQGPKIQKKKKGSKLGLE